VLLLRMQLDGLEGNSNREGRSVHTYPIVIGHGAVVDHTCFLVFRGVWGNRRGRRGTGERIGKRAKMCVFKLFGDVSVLTAIDLSIDSDVRWYSRADQMFHAQMGLRWH